MEKLNGPNNLGTNKIREAARWEDWEDQIDPKSAVRGPKKISRTGKGIPQRKKIF